MKLKLFLLNSDEVEISDVETFEFRTNRVSNWIRIKTKDTEIFKRDIATIKYIGKI